MKTRLDLLQLRPQFKKRTKKKANDVTLDQIAYIGLLIRANVTDPASWPPGTEHGAKALQRVRAIEKRCIAKLGYFDWGKLSPKLQDEYDGLCADLDALRDTGETVPLRDVLAEEGALHK
jgi:hypothetical protein